MNHVSTIKVTEVFSFDKAAVRTTRDGYVVANPRVGRIGIQLYQGKELGRPDMEVVRVYRPESEVMDKEAMASLAHRPVTNDHPNEPVTIDNWKKYSAGQTGGNVARDGEFIRVDMMLMDAGVIRDFNDGKKELSLGYTSNLEWRQGKTLQGEDYDAVQTMIRVNHLAVVDAARGGNKLAIGDSISLVDENVAQAKKLIADKKVNRKDVLNTEGAVSLASNNRYPFMRDGVVYRSALESIKAEADTNQHSLVVAAADELLTMIDATKQKGNVMNDVTEKLVPISVDGHNVQVVGDIAASVVLRRVKNLETEASDLASKLQKQADELKKAEDARKEAEAKASKKQEEDAATITTLKKQVEDAQMTPAKLDALVRDRATTIGKAKSVLGDKLIMDGKTDAEMRRQVVDAKLGDAAKGWSDDAVAASFATLTTGVKMDATINAADAAARALSGQPVTTNDREAPYANYDKKMQDAWRNPSGESKQH